MQPTPPSKILDQAPFSLRTIIELYSQQIHTPPPIISSTPSQLFLISLSELEKI